MTKLLGPDEEQFRALADSAPVLIWMSDISMRGIYFNRAWLDFTGRPTEREAGDGWMELLHPEDGAPIEAAREAFDARQPFQVQFRLRRHDGVWRWMLNSGKPRFNLNGEFTGYTGSCIDITERFEAEEEARRQFRLMQTITDNAAEGLFLMDAAAADFFRKSRRRADVRLECRRVDRRNPSRQASLPASGRAAVFDPGMSVGSGVLDWADAARA